MRYATGSFFHTAIAVCLCLLVTAMTAGPARTQTFTKLQVLLPGEVEAAGTPDGKAGSPVAQAAGVPFNGRIRACDETWNTVT